MEALFKQVFPGSIELVEDHRQPLLLQKDHLAAHDRAPVQVAQVQAGDIIGLRREAVLALEGHGEAAVAPAVHTGAEILPVHAGGVVGGGQLELTADGGVHIGVAPRVDEHILPGDARVQVQQVGVAVAGAQAAAVHVGPGPLRAPQHVVAAVRQGG